MKSKLILCSAFAVLCLLILFYAPAMRAATDGFTLWLSAVMPALFPFFVCSYIFMENISFKSRGLAIPAIFLLSAMSGAPGGARLCSMYFAKSERDDMLGASLNMLSPMFIVGTLSYGVLGNADCAIPIAIGHYLSAAVMTLASFLCFRNKKNNSAEIHRSPTGGLLNPLGEGLKQGFSSMLLILGTIIFFTVLSTVLESAGLIGLVARPFTALGLDYEATRAIITGIFEIASGLSSLKQVSGLSTATVAAIASAMISFGGICIFMQSRSFIKLNPLRYFGTKLVQGVLSGIICFFASKLFMPSETVFEPISGERLAENTLSLAGIAVSVFLPLCLVALFAVIKKR